ncbi:hypothetical protein LTR84_009963 [Exophiala bonariae]|uniref:Uncharacterized protein n=1 Tax=Exophiala bonariae TaxID=1690606 RepID=A0AAV9NKW7_9EURO|nr:hypothetical protein LTR84_009963 [Exophiala bonariae]
MTDEPTKSLRRGAITLTTASSEPDFTYPSLPLDLSLDSLLAHSQTPHSSFPKMTKSETDTASLAESWASLAETDISHEDDIHSEHTDVGSLLDVHSSEDVHSVIDAEIHDYAPDPDDHSETDDQESDISHSQKSLPFSPWDRSGFDAQQARSDLSTSLSNAQPSEHHPTTPPRYKVRSSFNEHQLRDLSLRIHGTVNADYSDGYTHMGLSSRGLDLNTLDYFKVILLGTSIEQFRPEIQRKLGDVLVSQGGSSQFSSRGSVTRYHLVPNTFGPGAEPDFADLVAIDKQIDFDCYDQVKGSNLPFENDKTNLCLKNRSTSSELVSFFNGRDFVVSQPRWIAPDLAIVCLELDHTGKLDSSSLQMLKFTERHQIPRIVIRMDRGWTGEYGHFEQEGALRQSLHKMSDKPFQNLQFSLNFPVDMAAFLNLESPLLNKHIAYIVSCADEDVRKDSPETTGYLDGIVEGKISKLPGGNITALFSTRHFVPIRLLALTIVATSVVGLLLSVLLPSPSSSLLARSALHNQFAQDISTTLISSSSATLQAAQTPLLGNTPLSLAALAKDDEAWQQQLESASVSRNEVTKDADNHFQVGIASANQLMVKLPKVATSSRKRSVLDVSLKREEISLPIILQELFDGVYSVTLEPRDSYGDIEVRLTMSNPQLTEMLTLSFGEPSFGRYERLKTVLKAVKSRVQNRATSLAKQATAARENIPSHRFLSEVGVAGMTVKAYFRKMWATIPGADLPYDLLKTAGDHLGNGLTAVRSVAALKGSEFSQQMHTRVVVDGLACAQNRAQQVVAKAANRLKGMVLSRQTAS